jgi:hypothetical protein
MQYQYNPVTKLSSFGKGRDSDLSNARYISRFGTLQDEMGNRIMPKDRTKEVEKRLRHVQNHAKSSFRVIISLPMNDNDRAQKLVLDELRSRYASFLVAFHATDDKGKLQPRLHCTIFNDQKKSSVAGQKRNF